MWDQTKTISNLEFRSIGIVVENKKRNTKIVEVYPVEILTDIDGLLNPAMEAHTKMGVDFEKKLYTVSVNASSSLPAEWMGATNRATAPDVRRGEQVRLYQSGDSDRWFWASMGRDDDLRRLETVVYTWNANSKIDDVLPSPNNCYSLEVSAHDKHVTFKTSKANGEYCTYVAQFNLKDGMFIVEDSLDNHMMLDSKNTHIRLKNKDNSFLSINKKNIVIKSDDKINLDTKAYTLDCVTAVINCETITTNASKSITEITKSYTVTASASYTLNTASYTLNGTANVINGPLMVNGAIVQSGGAVAFGGGGTFSSDCSFAKGLTVAGVCTLGDVNISGALTGTTGTFSTSVTAPNLKYT